MTAADGQALRRVVPRSAHAAWRAPPRDPVATLRRMSRSWLPELVEGRWQRMAASPFAFLRGTARIMAADLSTTPVTGIRVQAAGDAHLLNFGGFGSPERRLLFDVEDFDETLPGAWEWDVKRLAASVVLAARELGHEADAAAIGAAYRDAMAHYATLPAVAVWAAEVKAEGLKALGDNPRVWSHRTSRWEVPRLTAGDRIISDPPRTAPPPKAVARDLWALPMAYSVTLGEDRAALLERYAVVDVARHAVGVGSFGTRCFVIYMRGREGGDPLFLQVKEARASALGRSAFRHHGQRVVVGQRLAQTGADPLLGWATVGGVPVYVRQLRDMRGAVDLETFGSSGAFTRYGALCGRALAHAHARTGPAATIAGYLGSGDAFARALGRFAVAYADQTERDHAAFVRAIVRP